MLLVQTFPNIGGADFRHAMKIAAAACHLEAARQADIVKTAELSRLLWSVVLLGFLVFLFLLAVT